MQMKVCIHCVTNKKETHKETMTKKINFTLPLNKLSLALQDVFSKGKCVTVSLPTKEEQRDFYKQLSKKEGISLHGEEPYDYLCKIPKDYRTMKAEFVRLKYYMILEKLETGSLGAVAVKKYLEN